MGLDPLAQVAVDPMATYKPGYGFPATITIRMLLTHASGLANFVLGTIIEGITGQSYSTNLDQQIFKPLGLQNMHYVLPPAGLSATGYTNNGVGL